MPLDGLKNSHLHRANDDPLAGTTTYARFRYPFLEFPTLRSHIHPHLLIYNLGDKVKNDPDAAFHLIFHADRDLRALAQDVLSIYEIWMDVQPRRAAGFCVDNSQAASPGFISENGGSPEDVRNWDAPRPRTCTLSSSLRPSPYIVLPNTDSPDDESLDSMDSCNVEQVDWRVRPSTADKLWLEDMRRWQASSATGDYEYYAPWVETNTCPVSKVYAPLSYANTNPSDNATYQDDDTVFGYFSGYTSE